ncbi:MAG: site-specific DNA-methyltransferase, partial [Staphylococcus equorum]|nr:site-specific DNA-methyltransferase [Staphylococcus equorum]
YTKSDSYTFNKDDVGVKRGRKKRNNMKRNVDEDGRVYFSIKSNGKIYKYYEDELITPDDVWEISHLQQQDPERTGFNTQKPEKLLERIIKSTSNEGDIVLDFFMGSATTQAVAHKLNRQYIGIEQMDYIDTLSIPRLKKVIRGDQDGISKDVNWEGGGSFVYAELYELNQVYANKVQTATNQDEIKEVIEKIQKSDFLNLKVDLEKVFSDKEEFIDLTLDEQKAILIQVLDNNQLYLSYSEIDDDQYGIDGETKAFNASFYDEEV